MLCVHAQVTNTEVEVVSPELRLGPISNITAGDVTVKTEQFVLPANALVSPKHFHIGKRQSYRFCMDITAAVKGKHHRRAHSTQCLRLPAFKNCAPWECLCTILPTGLVISVGQWPMYAKAR